MYVHNLVWHESKRYSSLDFWSPVDALNPGCQSEEKEIPAGWGLAQDTLESQRVISSFPWGTNAMAVGNGRSYLTANA